MNCPICFQTMFHNSGCHYINNDSYRTSIFCTHRDCKALGSVRMSIICCPNQDWICDDYRLPICEYDNEWYILEGGPATPTINFEYGKYVISTNVEKNTAISKISDCGRLSFLINVQFIPISTGNDMHLHAKAIFDSLIKLKPFW